jgi:hypothetical protein
MTKNTKTILLSLLACLLLITGFELGEGRLRFGGATLNDSLTSRVTINKGLQVNGVITSSDTLRTSGILRSTELQLTGASPQIYWTTYGMYIDGGIDALTYNANAHTINTESGTALLYADSATGVGIKINSGANFTGSLVKTKLVKGITPATTATFGNYPHGITNGRILGFTCLVKRDTIASFSYQNDPMYPPNSAIPAYSYNAYVDSVNCGVYMLASATYLLGDSAFFLVHYLD